MHRLEKELECLAFVFRELRAEVGSERRGLNQVLVVDELIAIVAEQVRGRFLHAQADNVLAIFLELGDQGRKVRVARNDDEGVNVFLGKGEVHGIDAQADVRGVFAGLGALGDLDQLDGGFVKWSGVLPEAAPVGIGFLGDDLALFDQALQHALDVETIAPVLKTESQVLKVDENSQRPLAVCHNNTFHEENTVKAMSLS